MKNIHFVFSLVLILLVQQNLSAQNARIQVLHNSPDTSILSVDVYINGVLEKDNLYFRTASQYIDVVSGSQVSIGIAPSTSASAADTFYNCSVSLSAGENYIAILSGIYNSSLYSANDPVNLYFFGGAKEFADSTMYNDLLFFNGSPDAPSIDAMETHYPMGLILDNLQRNEFSGYINMETKDYIFNFSDYLQSSELESIKIPLYSFCLFSYAVTIVSSGFTDPVLNNNGPEFGIFLVWPFGGAFFELDRVELANIQFIHNSADLALQEIDVYRNNELLIDDFDFRTATPFLNLSADIYHDISIAPSNSSSKNDAIETFMIYPYANYNTIAVLNGIHSASGYSPAEPLKLISYYNGRLQSAQQGNTDLLFFHGSTDAPDIDIVSTGTGTLVNDAWLNSFRGYLEVPVSDYIFDVSSTDQNITYSKHHALFSSLNLDNKAITILTSGFMNPSLNSNGEEFGLFMVTAEGGSLIPLPHTTTGVSDYSNNNFGVYPNPANDFTVVSFSSENEGEITLKLLDMNGKLIEDFGRYSVDKNSEIKLNLSAIQPGQYYILAKSLDGNSKKSLVIYK